MTAVRFLAWLLAGCAVALTAATVATGRDDGPGWVPVTVIVATLPPMPTTTPNPRAPLAVVLVASPTPTLRAVRTPDPAPPPTPFVRTPTPVPPCWDGTRPGAVCVWTGEPDGAAPTPPAVSSRMGDAA